MTKVIRANGCKKSFLEEIKKRAEEKGVKRDELVFRCLPGAEGTSKYQEKIFKVISRNIENPQKVIVALCQEDVEQILNNDVKRIEVYDKTKLQHTGYKNIYQFNPGSMVGAFNRDSDT